MLIRCLGMIGVLDGSGETSLTRSQRHIVAILVAAGPAGISSAHFADELWGDDLPAQWQASVRQAIRRMRRSLPIGALVTRNSRYAFDLDTASIDVWKLLATNDLDLANEPEILLQTMLAGEPFADVEHSPILHHQLEPIAAARLNLIQAMRGHHPDRWAPETLVAARTLTARSHYRDDLLVACLELHIAAGTIAAARKLGEDAGRYVRDEMGVELSPAAADLLAAIAAGTSRNVAASDEPDDSEVTLSGRIVGVYDTIKDLGLIERPRITHAIQAGLSGPGVIVDGESGAGKSALVKSVVLPLATQGRHVLWLAGRRGTPGAYSSFIARLPAIEEDLAPLLEDGGNELLRMQCWAAARRRLTTEFTGLPLVIVVDDAHWLDSHSQRLIIFLASTQGPAAPALIVIGRDDATARGWNNFAHELDRVGLSRVNVDEFTTDQLVELIGMHHPASTSKQRHDFAATLTSRRAALPAIAHELVRSADPSTLAVTDRVGADRQPDLWVERVPPSARRVAAIAAVVGMRFRLPEVAALSGLEIEPLVEAVDQLLDAQVLAAEQRPDEFSFRHVLIHADFDGVLNRGERRKLHLAASEIAERSGDIHAHASHLVEAGALVDNAQIVDAVLASARKFQTQGSHREAVEAFTHARQIVDGELRVDDLLSFAAAISSSGGDDWDLRTTAFDLSHAAGDADLCLDVALSGALRTEDAMGQPRRVAMLERIDPRPLSPSRRVVHSAALARELGLLGLHEQAISTAASAIALATTADDRFAAWLGAWASCRALPPADWPELPSDRNKVVTPEHVSRVAQVDCARALLLGDDAGARRWHVAFASHGFTQADPLRRWHAALVEATLSFVDGRWHDHRRQADAAFTAASQQAVIAAFGARVAQEFVLQWIVGQHGALLPQFETAPPDIQSSLLARAAHAITLAEYPERRAEATTQIAVLAQDALTHRSPLSLSAAAILASAPAECLSAGTKERLRQVLKPFQGTALVVGATLSHLGPVTWSLARLADNADERIELLKQACDEAEQWNLRLWQVVSLRDLAAATEAPAPLAAARALAAGTSLELVP